MSEVFYSAIYLRLEDILRLLGFVKQKRRFNCYVLQTNYFENDRSCNAYENVLDVG